MLHQIYITKFGKHRTGKSQLSFQPQRRAMPNNDPTTIQFSSVQSLCRVRLFATPWIEVLQASLSNTNSRSSLKLTSIQSVMPSNHVILCRPLLLLPPIPPSIRVFSNESTLCMRWPKYWSFSFSNYHTNILISHATKDMLKTLQAMLQQYVNQELPAVQAGFRKGQKNQRSNCQYLLDHRESKGIPEKHPLLPHWLHESLWRSQQTIANS